MDLDEQSEKVSDLNSFLNFVKALVADREDEIEKEKPTPAETYRAGLNGWENTTVERFQEAAVAWAEDSHSHRELPEEPSWKSFARFLHAGKSYE
jgi:hypothetical protein